MAFYESTRTMQSYQAIIAENTTVVLSTDSDLFKFLKGMNPDDTALIGWLAPSHDAHWEALRWDSH